ncbi:hypothetical protein TNCT_517091 [Trichonephila clavata]|uniref:Uncharacterized protein n=1 Tax=Trichonephila clavata TaxID=2740835 RepID=A0A8X6EXT0_TRICU|nr:hypothetical protein TNCT_517091 [Trichonephila clavata]
MRLQYRIREKSLMPLKTRLRVSDVYSDSDGDLGNESINEESPPPSHKTSKSPAEMHAVRLMVLSVPMS